MWTSLLGVVFVGFFAVTLCHLTRVWFLRQPGYIPLFVVLAAGTVSFSFGDMLVTVGGGAFCFFASDFCETLSGELRTPTVTPLFVNRYAELHFLASLVVATLMAAFINRLRSSSDACRIFARLEGNHLELLLEQSLEDQFLVELTLGNGKVYIGHAHDSGISAVGHGDITLIPFISGYRHKDTKMLRLTTFYHRALANFAEGDEAPLQASDFQVVLPKGQIRSARRFDPDVYLKEFSETTDEQRNEKT